MSISFLPLRAACLALALALTLLALMVAQPAWAQNATQDETAKGAVQTEAAASEDALATAMRGLVEGGFQETGAAIEAMAATGDPRAAPVLRALRAGDLFWRKSDKRVVVTQKAPSRSLAAQDALTGEDLGVEKKRAFKKIKVNNALRRAIDNALGGLTLRAAEPEVRLKAAEALFKSRDAAALPALDAALESESDDAVRDAMRQARAAIVLMEAGASEAERVAAAQELGARADQAALSVLSGVDADAPAAVAEAVAAARDSIERSVALWGYAETVWYGLSLGSVLMLAAIGLAITFGVMGVINMAHGELVMLGAYTTFAVQEAIRVSAPELFDVSLLIAAPLAFLVAGGAGVAIERGVVRYLYGRPLETLLATWGVSLILQQTVRVIFGPNNREVGNPSWMSGSFDIGLMTVTYSRLWILIFALAVFALLLLALKKTSLGLQMRAVTQNRAMARDMGVRTDWVDALTFRAGRRRRRAGRGGAQPDRQRLPQSRPELHRRQLHGGGVRRGGQSVGGAGRGLHPRRRQQVPGAFRRRCAGQDPGAGFHHSIHSTASARALRHSRPGRGVLNHGP